MLYVKNFFFKDKKKYIKNVSINNNINLKLVSNLYFSKFDKNFKFFLFFKSREVFFMFKLINNLIVDGKKDKAIFIFFNVIKNIKFLSNFENKLNPFFILDIVLRRSILVLKIKKKRIAGKVHHIPLFLKYVNQINYSLKSFVYSVRLRIEKNIILKFIFEIKSILENDINSSMSKRKKLLYLQAINNKFYVKFL